MKSKLLSMIVALCVLLSCVTIPAQAAGLTLINSITGGVFPTSSSDWIYSADSNEINQPTDGLGGKSTSDPYASITVPGSKTARGALLMITNKDYYDQRYYVYTYNIYGNHSFQFIIRYSSAVTLYDYASTTGTLLDGRWNNIAVVVDTSDNKADVYVNGEVVVPQKSTGYNAKRKPEWRIQLMDAVRGETAVINPMDDFGFYKTNTEPTIAMPTLSAGTNYTVSGDAITLTGAATVADLVAQTGATVRAYTDSTLATALESTATLSNGNYVVVEAPFNEANEGVKVYNYYSVGAGSEGGEGGEEPEEPEEPVVIGGKLPDNKNVTWSYDEDTKVLSFEGTGALTDWADGTAYTYNKKNDPGTEAFNKYGAGVVRAWKDYAESVEKVVIGEGITSIGSNSFRAFTNLTEVVFPAKSLTEIKDGAFAICNSLKTITLPASVNTIGEAAFKVKAAANAVLESFTFLGNPSYIDNTLFDNQRSTLVIYTNSTNTNVLNMAKTKIYDYVLLDKDYEIVYDADKQIATARNFTKSPVSVAIIVASYGSGCLADVDFTTVTIPAAGKEGKKTLTFTGTHVPGGYVRAMLWDGFDTVTPLCPFARVSIPEAE